MAVLLRCSCFFTHASALRSPPSENISSGAYVPGKLESLLCKVRCTSDADGGTFKIHNVPPSNWRTKPVLHCQKSEGHHTITHVPQVSRRTSAPTPALQGRLRIPATALFFAEALILTTPLKALAETCETDNSFLKMPILLFVALVGATVGGLLARQRRGELARLNEQLRQINTALRRQAKIESYAPSLSYAPVGGRVLDEVLVDPSKQELLSRLKAGKNFLRNQEPEKAFLEFKTALELAQNLKDAIEEKKAARGLGASLQRQGKYRDAIKYHSMVLAISQREVEDSGNTEAYGAIADCYTELGELEKAGKFYDKYIARLEKD